MPIFGKKKSDPEALMREGLNYLRNGMYEKAQELFRRGLDISPQYNELHYLLGLAHLKQGEEKEAEHEFKKTLDRNPHHTEARRERETILLKRKEKVSEQICKKERHKGDLKKSMPHYEGEEWEEVKRHYTEYFSELKETEGEQSFRNYMVWQEFAFKFQRRRKDAPSFFFFTEKHRAELSGEIFDLILRHVSSLPKESKKMKDAILEQADWIARNIGDDSHIARIEKVSWG